MGYPKCCSAPGGDIMNCPKEQPPCNPDTDQPTPSPSESDNDDTVRGTGRACDYKQCTNQRNVNKCPPSMCDIDNGETCVKSKKQWQDRMDSIQQQHINYKLLCKILHFPTMYHWPKHSYSSLLQNAQLQALAPSSYCCLCRLSSFPFLPW